MCIFLFCWKPDSSSKKPKAKFISEKVSVDPSNYTCRYDDATTFTCDATRVRNITINLSLKIAPKPLVLI